MQASMMLPLIGCLLAPSGAYILGRCVVAKRLYEGGLDYFEGYSLANWVCLAYFESKFNPSAVYENSQDGYTGFGLFQIRDSEWCDHGKNLCSVSCSALLNPDLKKTIQCVKRIVKGKKGMGAWPSWYRYCQLSDTLDRWLDGCKLSGTGNTRQLETMTEDIFPFAASLNPVISEPFGSKAKGHESIPAGI